MIQRARNHSAGIVSGPGERQRGAKEAVQIAVKHGLNVGRLVLRAEVFDQRVRRHDVAADLVAPHIASVLAFGNAGQASVEIAHTQNNGPTSLILQAKTLKVKHVDGAPNQ